MSLLFCVITLNQKHKKGVDLSLSVPSRRYSHISGRAMSNNAN